MRQEKAEASLNGVSFSAHGMETILALSPPHVRSAAVMRPATGGPAFVPGTTVGRQAARQRLRLCGAPPVEAIEVKGSVR